MKVSRATILFKTNMSTMKKIIRPNSVYTVKFEGKKLMPDEVRSIRGYLVLYFIILISSLILVSLFGGEGDFSTLETNATSVITALGNVGPAFGNVGYSGGMASYSVGAKLILCADMLIGRLEIFPIIALFFPSTWQNR